MSDSTSRPARLLALGATAVVAIYAAGFDRTRVAALRLAEEDGARRRSPVEARSATPSQSDDPVVGAVAAAPLSTVPAASEKVAAPLAAAPSVRDPATRSATSAATAAKEARGDTAVTAATAPVSNAPAQPDPILPSPTDSTSPAPTDTAPAVAKWRDGTFTGWGNSRHGSIEATVTIKDGRIVGAYISRCQTRYSCSWIEHLQIQVVDRQGPDVDFVSGATQSVNAFYYAVVDALEKAK